MAHLLDIPGQPQPTYIIANQVPPRAQLAAILLAAGGPIAADVWPQALKGAFDAADAILDYDAATVGQSRTLAKVT